MILSASSPHKFYRMTPSFHLHSRVCPHHMKNNHSGRPPTARFYHIYVSIQSVLLRFASCCCCINAHVSSACRWSVLCLFQQVQELFFFLSKCSRKISFYCSLEKIFLKNQQLNTVNDSLHLNAGRYPTQCFGTKYCNHCLLINGRNNGSFQPACEGKNNLGHAELLPNSRCRSSHIPFLTSHILSASDRKIPCDRNWFLCAPDGSIERYET